MNILLSKFGFLEISLNFWMSAQVSGCDHDYGSVGCFGIRWIISVFRVVYEPRSFLSDI
jgi:hypothetical protein